MFDLVFQIGRQNWVLGEIVKRGKYYMVYLTKHVHTKVVVKKYDDILTGLELIRTDTKAELLDICEQFVYQIEKGDKNE